MAKVTDKDYYMNELLLENLDILKKAVGKKWDGFIMIDGIEGSAKTTFGAAISYYLDPNYSLDNVVFTQEEFFIAIDKAKPGTVIHWDEFVFGGLSTEALNKVQNSLIKKITTIRKKRLFVILIMPWFFMMRPYFAIGRSRCLIHVYTPDGISRGSFSFYSYKKKQTLYHVGKKTYQYSVSPDFYGRFTNTEGIFWDIEEYEKKKDAAIELLTEDKKSLKIKNVELQRNKLMIELRDVCRYGWRDISRILKVPTTTLNNWYATTKDILL